MLPRLAAVLVSLGLLIPYGSLSSQNPPLNYYPDDSDWWSRLNPNQPEPSMPPQEREVASGNFRVLGVSPSDRMFDRAAAKLGETQVLHRGDASAGRSQACYVSTVSPQKVFLIFEQGEVNFSFYLFSTTRSWNGVDRCTPSALVSRDLATASGLHLGQSPAEIIAILGKPSSRAKDGLFYFLHARKKNSAADLKIARDNNPDMSDADLHSSFDYYDLTVAIDARFSAGKLASLAGSECETY